ncbi:Invasion protein B [uncultured Caudovirales phage]|uniref:Invasion protein B n=1 Tax=uncultured Caudovirales phage TaxID=2100421 RepID=A0A6J5RVC4_9CAUD|nr:Invasion protein B [uncultured Caudovirales phage]CAB4195914.1 Invasion protein B [uncultured Caudovirales phage]CAB4222619.1 Invasion protein B [uncultured Caudovirales phage]
MRRWTFGLVALLAVQPAAAETIVARNGAWTTACKDNRMTDKRECEVAATLDGARFAPATYDYLVSYSVSSGLFFASGAPEPMAVRVRVDSLPASSLAMCTRGVCMMKKVPSAALAGQMRKGTQLLVEFIGVSMPPEPLELSLSGFDAAYQQALAEQKKR